MSGIDPADAIVAAFVVGQRDAHTVETVIATIWLLAQRRGFGIDDSRAIAQELLDKVLSHPDYEPRLPGEPRPRAMPDFSRRTA